LPLDRLAVGVCLRLEADSIIENVSTGGGSSGDALLIDEVRLIVGPFSSFSAVHEFRIALAGVAGVRAVRVRRFYQGRLHLLVRYDGATPLPDRLARLNGWAGLVTVPSSDMIQLELSGAPSGVS